MKYYHAVLEFISDDFIESWGPHFSCKAASRRAKALARQQRAEAREAAREARRAAEDAAEASGVPLGPATWDNGGGWGASATGWGGEPSPSPWWTGGDWDGNGGDGRLLGNDNHRRRKPPRRFSHPWPRLHLVRRAPTFFKTVERLNRAYSRAFRRLSAELHRMERIRLREERHELRRLRCLGPDLL